VSADVGHLTLQVRRGDELRIGDDVVVRIHITDGRVHAQVEAPRAVAVQLIRATKPKR